MFQRKLPNLWIELYFFYGLLSFNGKFVSFRLRFSGAKIYKIWFNR